MRLWKCPDCGNAVRAPERPRKDDTRRYCLDCSKSTGRLVERSCPALDRERAERTEKATAKRKAKADREKAAALDRRSRGGHDLDEWARRFWRLPAMKEQRRWTKRVPSITYREKRTGHRYSGHAKTWSQEVVLTLRRDLDPARAIEIVLHELVHCVLPTGTRHSPKFRSTLMAAAVEAFGVEHFQFTDADGLTMWALDERIADGVRTALATREAAA